MAISQPHALSGVCCSSSNSQLIKHSRTWFFNKKRGASLDHLLINQAYSRKRCRMKLSFLENENLRLSCRVADFRSHCLALHKSRKMGRLLPRSSANDDLTVNGRSSASDDVEQMRVKLAQSLQGEDYSSALVQSLHDAARVYELAIKDQSSKSKKSWFSTAWLGVDRKSWLKALSYQAAVYSLLQAACEISSRGDGRDRDINVFVERSLLRQSAPLESVIRDEISAKQPEVYDWFWSEQVPAVVTSFVNYFEKDQHFAAATAVYRKGVSLSSGDASDKSLLMLALSCIAAITKLGPAKVSCAQFFSMVPDVTGRVMDMLIEFIPIHHAYNSIKGIGLRREFLVHFGPRAARCRVNDDQGTEEVLFWVSLVQKQLQRAIHRERIWSRLTTTESIEVLEKDLAMFGFFIALGRRTQSFLYANGFEAVHEPIEGFIRYLIGGSVLYYPQLSSISSYQLYVEVVCEELDWLPFYPGDSDSVKLFHGHKNKREAPPNPEAIPLVLDVCSHWIQSFIKYSKWLEDPSNVKVARFLSRGHNKLVESSGELGISKNQMIESKDTIFREMTGSATLSLYEKEPDSFNKALESVEEALMRLEDLLQELHVSNSSSGNEHLKAACSDLERIRTLKKEAEFLEASFRARADSVQQGDDGGRYLSTVGKLEQYPRRKDRKGSDTYAKRLGSNLLFFWNFFARGLGMKSGPRSTAYRRDGLPLDQASVGLDVPDPEADEFQRFEQLRNELMELENRVQKGARRSNYEEEDIKIRDDTISYSDEAEGNRILSVQVQKKENIYDRYLDKFKEATTDVLQGTQLLAIDVAAASGLLRRVIIGDELTGKEKQALRRTLTDLAAVIPIGILMLLPVTAVGHAAMLAAIQRYVPSMIPSTYGPERLDLLRQLNKVKELESTEGNPTDPPNETQSL